MFHHHGPARESDPHAQPNLEVFYLDGFTLGETDDFPPPGWYYWCCFPGCLPDSEPTGPFETEALALEDARNN